MRRQQGFTLIEVMVVVAIAAMLAAFGLPSFNDFVLRMRIGSSMSELGADVQLARSESIRRNAKVLVCPRASATATTCATVVTAAAWMNGWLVCHDTDANGACDASSATDPNPIRVRNGPRSPLTLSVVPVATLTFFPVGSASARTIFTFSAGAYGTRSATIEPSGSITYGKT